MAEWKKYTGSDEQIEEMRQSANGFVARNASSVSSIMSVKLNQLFISGQKDPYLPELFGNKISEFLNYNNTTHYLICNPHPYADMICQQARTGQQVWVKGGGAKDVLGNPIFQYCMYGKDINWNIPNAEYSFTEFKEEV